jgi:hypothetical protein
MNVLAAQRRAAIRRVFIVTEDDDRAALRQILLAHSGILKDLRTREPSVQMDFKELTAGGFYTGVVRLHSADIPVLAKQGLHNYGVLLKGASSLLMVPVYRSDKVISTLQFRSDAALIEQFRQDFDQQLRLSQPLDEFLAEFN